MVAQLGSRRGERSSGLSDSKICGLSTIPWYLRLWRHYNTWCIETMDASDISSSSVTHGSFSFQRLFSNGFQDQSLLITTQVWQWLEQQLSIISQQYQVYKTCEGLGGCCFLRWFGSWLTPYYKCTGRFIRPTSSFSGVYGRLERRRGKRF